MNKEARPTYGLGGRLPPEVLLGGNAIWSRYRQFPVFSARWLLGRSVLFGIVIALVAGVIGFGVAVASRQLDIGIKAGLAELAAFTLMATLGPGLASLVRYRGWSAKLERRGVVVAVVLGVVLSLFVDRLASAYVGSLMHPAMAQLGMHLQPPPKGSVLKAASLAVNLLVLLAIYGLFGGGLALRAYFSEQRRWDDHHRQVALDAATAQARDADLRLGVLQAQVEPHFLFNTLASVRALVRQDPAQAEATLDALVDFLRATIPKLRDGQAALHSTLGEQLDLCARYLALMQLRMGGRLQHSVQAEPSLRVQAFPPSLLITLVENAIKHGIEPKPGPGRVDLLASIAHGLLWVQVCDDGAGLREGTSGGMGLVNVRQQLAARFGDRAVLRLRALDGGGVCAEVGLPMENPDT